MTERHDATDAAGRHDGTNTTRRHDGPTGDEGNGQENAV